ncbi:MAG: ATP synthase F1 subunit epsilon [Mycoplasmataceae bacterium]|jgi:F-type H+-transporting ATPase subunit epsilon|nr:ATP synthase F1 subunit epsilon [Mycoplasmataceae bacterium]
MAKEFKLKINTPSGIFFEDNVFQVELKTVNGYIGILNDHAPMIGSVIPSICFIRDAKGNRLSALINNAIFKMDGKVLNIITDYFDFTDNVDDSVFEKRKKQIDRALNNKNIKDSKSYALIETKLEQELNQLKKIAKK